MRAVLLLLLALAGCTFGAAPTPVFVPHTHDPDQMPAATLDHQDPGADTTGNPELSRFEWHQPSPMVEQLLGCARWLSCSGGGAHPDASGALLLAAISTVTLRRHQHGRSRPRRASQTG